MFYALFIYSLKINYEADEDAIITKISEPKFRVIGGVESNAGGVPYQICIRWYPFCNCGGAIYNSKTIITAARNDENIFCKRPKFYLVYFGQTASIPRLRCTPRIHWMKWYMSLEILTLELKKEMNNG